MALLQASHGGPGLDSTSPAIISFMRERLDSSPPPHSEKTTPSSDSGALGVFVAGSRDRSYLVPVPPGTPLGGPATCAHKRRRLCQDVHPAGVAWAFNLE